MKAFFNKWQRAAGVLMLAITLPLLVMWVRSLYISDFIRLTKYGTHIAMLSGAGRLRFVSSKEPNSSHADFAWQSQAVSQISPIQIHDNVWLLEQPGRIERLEVVERSIVLKMERSNSKEKMQLENTLTAVRDELTRLKSTVRLSIRHVFVIVPLVIISILLIFVRPWSRHSRQNIPSAESWPRSLPINTD